MALSINYQAFEIALIVGAISMNFQQKGVAKISTSNGSITRNRNPKREPQNNYIKETLIVIMSATLERSLSA